MLQEDVAKFERGTDRDRARNERRRFLIAGAVVVPTILTLHATPAWATTDYTLTAYRYGAQAGLCRNAHFNPNASPNSQSGQEFIECRQSTQFEDDPGRPTRQDIGDDSPTTIRIK